MHAATTQPTPITALSDGQLADAISREAYTAPDFCRGDTTDLLAEKAKREENRDPALKAKRLRTNAIDLWNRGERLRQQASEFYSKAAYRVEQGELQLAADFERRGDALTREANDLQAKSCTANCDAALIEGELERFAMLARVALPPASLFRVRQWGS